MGAFHAYDIRGVYNVDFDRNTAYKVGYFLRNSLALTRFLSAATAGHPLRRSTNIL